MITIKTRTLEVEHRDKNDVVTHVQTLVRRTPGGSVVPIGRTGLTWQDLVTAGPRVTGGRSIDSDHPSHKHLVARPLAVVTPSADVPGPVPGQPRRRDRRVAERAVKKAARLLVLAGAA